MERKYDKAVFGLLAEAGMLKRTCRAGWQVLGVKDPESVGDHSFRCAVIAYALCRMEGEGPERAVLMALFNDMHESRIGDLHKMAQRYVDFDKAEAKAFDEQIKGLPGAIKKDLGELHKEYRAQKTKPAIIARDADILECLIQAREYQSQGFKDADRFMKKSPGFLKTKSARSLWKAAKTADVNKWWEDLSGFRR